MVQLVGLRRCDLDLERQIVRVPRRIAELRDGTMEAGPTRTAAGVRTVSIPAVVIPELHRHLAEHVNASDPALIFTGRQGGSLRRGNYRRAVRWEASLAAGLPEGFHFHDLRHTGDHLAAQAGASTRELMHRMGHASERAALIYQHATGERAARSPTGWTPSFGGR